MGYREVTGTVFRVPNESGRGGSIECDQTGAIEMLDPKDGKIELI